MLVKRGDQVAAIGYATIDLTYRIARCANCHCWLIVAAAPRGSTMNNLREPPFTASKSTLTSRRLEPLRSRRRSGLEIHQGPAARKIERCRDMIVHDQPSALDLPEDARVPNPGTDPVGVAIAVFTVPLIRLKLCAKATSSTTVIARSRIS